MAGPVLNLKIFTKSTYHTLRAVSVITFPPAFFFLLIQGIASRRVNPAISLLPLFFSSFYSLFLLANERQCGCQASGLTGTPIHLVCDLLLGIGLLVCLILTWVFLPQHWDGPVIMLGTYCTNFIIVNFLVHLHFTLRTLYEAMAPGQNYPSSCPRCQNGGPFFMAIQKGLKSGYTPLLDRDGGPRGSVDEDDEQRLDVNQSAV
ncbi:hypothetical protein P154DRAFT_439078 [Amniculicola lignicola CBS 123094]|uniref:MARVEL domain-containing protein n=1 Tax=Amniculicola lignicola CBS 123094 TaxID=1392246 RepID=A0A6A5WAW5_9PLEO|nr:hypothetical protein P154DRAFT_439078 [Amniculicola lignicola CBS 123094]